MNKVFFLIGISWLLVALFALATKDLSNGLGVVLFPGFMAVVFLVLGFSGNEPS